MFEHVVNIRHTANVFCDNDNNGDTLVITYKFPILNRYATVAYFALGELRSLAVIPSRRPLTDTSWKHFPCSSYQIIATNQQYQATY